MAATDNSMPPEDLDALVSVATGRDPRVRFAYLFGSTACGEQRAGSDVDVAVYVDPRGSLLDDGRLQQALVETLGREDVDLMILNDAPVWLRFRVVGEGRLVLSRDERLRFAFREQVTHGFLDFRPYYDEYLAAVRERARRGALSRG